MAQTTSSPDSSLPEESLMLTLPAELRLRIYDHCLGVPTEANEVNGSVLVNLLENYPAIRHEHEDRNFGDKTVVFTQTTDIARFAALADKDVLLSVKKVTLDMCGAEIESFPYIQELQPLTQLPALEKVIIFADLDPVSVTRYILDDLYEEIECDVRCWLNLKSIQLRDPALEYYAAHSPSRFHFMPPMTVDGNKVRRHRELLRHNVRLNVEVKRVQKYRLESLIPSHTTKKRRRDEWAVLLVLTRWE
ncbi:hypothetical protein LTR08_002410 [Meristemomyces frigidus]|nr:hypothetical protein LTR08_002410 [Meristemomyces frigidus]